MKETQFEILPIILLDEYLLQIKSSVSIQFDGLKDSNLSADTFSFYTSVSAVFSSKIEGENIELDSYIKYKKFGVSFLPDYTRKTDDLYNAYQFAKQNRCNKDNLQSAHK